MHQENMPFANVLLLHAQDSSLLLNEVMIADILHITPKHLSDVVKSTFGKSPRQMINDMLLLEAKVLLGSTDLTVSEIAYKLQFQDHAHLSHFIRQHAGCTPLELRKKL